MYTFYLTQERCWKADFNIDSDEHRGSIQARDVLTYWITINYSETHRCHKQLQQMQQICGSKCKGISLVENIIL
jgi:hypothetical protein